VSSTSTVPGGKPRHPSVFVCSLQSRQLIVLKNVNFTQKATIHVQYSRKKKSLDHLYMVEGVGNSC
jgi:hypothetical protein